MTITCRTYATVQGGHASSRIQSKMISKSKTGPSFPLLPKHHCDYIPGRRTSMILHSNATECCNWLLVDYYLIYFGVQSDLIPEGMPIGITAMVANLPSTETCSFDAVRGVPLERWDVDNRTTDARFGSFVREAELFDASAFSISR